MKCTSLRCWLQFFPSYLVPMTRLCGSESGFPAGAPGAVVHFPPALLLLLCPVHSVRPSQGSLTARGPVSPPLRAAVWPSEAVGVPPDPLPGCFLLKITGCLHLAYSCSKTPCDYRQFEPKLYFWRAVTFRPTCVL